MSESALQLNSIVAVSTVKAPHAGSRVKPLNAVLFREGCCRQRSAKVCATAQRSGTMGYFGCPSRRTKEGHGANGAARPCKWNIRTKRGRPEIPRFAPFDSLSMFANECDWLHRGKSATQPPIQYFAQVKRHFATVMPFGGNWTYSPFRKGRRWAPRTARSCAR